MEWVGVTHLLISIHFWLTAATDVFTTTYFGYGMGWGNTLTDLYTITRFWYEMGWGNTLTDLYTASHF